MVQARLLSQNTTKYNGLIEITCISLLHNGPNRSGSLRQVRSADLLDHTGIHEGGLALPSFMAFNMAAIDVAIFPILTNEKVGRTKESILSVQIWRHGHSCLWSGLRKIVSSWEHICQDKT